MAIDFNVAPYHDDFSPSSRYYRILYKPSRSVQARELTQMQSILQNQIAAMGTNVFKEGTIILGGKTFFYVIDYVTITGTSTPTEFVDKVIVGVTSGARARVIQVTPYEVFDSVTYPPALHFQYIDGTETFQAGEAIVIEGTTTTVTLTDNALFSGKSKVYNIQDSVFFTNGFFVFCPSQTAVVGRLTSVPSAIIGLKIKEGIANSDDDPSLLDPAVGSNNYFAPGADRYFIDLELSVINFDPDVEGSEDQEIPNFIQLAKCYYGDLLNPPLKTDFNEVESMMARRTYDESGDYTVRPFIAQVVNHRYGSNLAHSIKVSTGKAYVRGYEFETTAPLYLTLDRALDTARDSDFPVVLSYGNYIQINEPTGMFYPTKAELVYLSRSTAPNVSYSSNAAFQANVVGTARVRYVDWSGTGNVYNMYLYNIAMKTDNVTGASNVFSETNSIISATISGASVTPLANSNVLSFGNAAIISPQRDNTSLFLIPQRFVKTLTPNAVSNISFLGGTLFEDVQFTSVGGGKSSGQIEVGLPNRFTGTGELSATLSNSYYQGVVVTSASGPPVGTRLIFGVTGKSNVVVSSTSSLSRSTLTVTDGGSFTANIFAVVNYRQGSAGSKLKNANTRVKVVTADPDGNVTGNLLAVISLDYPDVSAINSVIDATGNSAASFFTLDTGLRDDYYEHATLRALPGNNIPLLNVTTNPNLTITYTVLEHTDVNQTGYFTVDSYQNLDFADIPTYTNAQGRKVNLSDVLDFRAVRLPNSNTFVSPVVPVPDSTFTTTVDYYLPRKDKIVITKDRKMKVIKGVPAKTPTLPSDLTDAMTIYTITLAPYTARPEDVKLVYNENKRYTMRDIGKLERRINKLEYYTALSFLEKIAADEKVPSALPGIDRFKNGIMVDSFAGHSVSDVGNKDLRCSIDYERRLLRPMFVADSYLYSVLPQSNNFKLSGDILTIDYREAIGVVDQTLASNTVPLMPFAVFNWVGTMKLSPQTDFWKDTKTNPAVIFNLNGENDPFTIIEPKNGFNATASQMKFSNWENTGITDLQVTGSTEVRVDNNLELKTDGLNLSAGITSQATATTTVNTSYKQVQGRVGLEINSAERVINASIGNRIVDSSLLPYIRPRTIEFVAQQLKPNTKLFATFDNIDVSDYVFPAARIRINSNLNNANVRYLSNTMSGGGLYANASVIFQRKDGPNVTVLFVRHSGQSNVFAVGNVATLYLDTGVTATHAVTGVTFPSTEDGLITTERGEAVGVFAIPNNDAMRFNVGERAFRLSNSLNRDLEETVAETIYLAQGITQTREEAIVATRVKDVSINPVFQTKAGATVNKTTSTTVTGPATSAESNSVALPGGSSRTLFCGEGAKASGGIGSAVGNPNNPGSAPGTGIGVDVGTGQGVHDFRINLGVKTGLVRIRCWHTPAIINTYTTGVMGGFMSWTSVKASDSGQPEKFTVRYRGEEYTTGFIGNRNFNQRLLDLGYEDVFSAPPGGFADITFFKHDIGEEFCHITVDAPMPGTGWQFAAIACPNTLPETAPGQCSIRAADAHAFFIEEDARRTLQTVHGISGVVLSEVDREVIRTSRSKGDYKFTISNPSQARTSRTYKAEDDSVYTDRSITINSISVDTSKMTALDNFSYEIITTGESKGNDDAEGLNPDRTDARLGGRWTNTLGSLPVTLLPGQSRTFSLRLFKDSPRPSVGRSKGPKGRLIVTADVEGPTGPATLAKVNAITGKLEIDTVVGSSARSTTVQYYDPVAQTFIVDARSFPDGYFLSSIDLWFQSKDPVQPVQIQIRPAIEGRPSADIVLPFGTKTLAAEDIVASTTFDQSKFTRFKFDTPVYLTPQEYAVVVLCMSTEARLYISTLGQFKLGTTTPERIREQPYLGELFLSQNARSWVPEPLSDLTIRVNRARFLTENTANVTMASTTPVANTEYDLFYTQGDLIEFADTFTSYAFLTSTPSYDGGGNIIGALSDIQYLRYNLGTNYPLNTRKVVLRASGETLKLNLLMASTSDYISPVIDMGRLGSVLVRNIINNDATGEDGIAGGNAQARYITRKVVLNPDFESQDIKVYLNAFLPKNSSIKVYYKVNAPGTTNFELENRWTLMYETNKVGNEREGFAEFIFETSPTLNDPFTTALPDGAKFSIFQIKIVMLSDDTTKVPIIRDLRAIAFDE